MPHECTSCGHTFPDGSKEMLSGCPECGGNKFQFLPSGEGAPPTGKAESSPGIDPSTAASSLDPSSEPGDDPATRPGDESTVPVDESPVSDTDRIESPSDPDSGDGSDMEFPGVDGSAVDDTTADDRDTIDPETREDRAQASARSTVVSEDELRSIDESPGRSAVEDLPPSDLPPDPSDSAERAPEQPSDDERREDAGDPDDAEPPDIAELRRELNDQFESIKILQPGEYELNLMELYDREERIIALEEDGRYVIDVPSSWRDEEE